MWSKVRKQFSRQFVRSDVVRKMIECGMRVDRQAKIYVGDVEVDYTAIAKAVGVDRRVVKKTAEQIEANEILYTIFSKIKPLGASLVDVVGRLGYTAVIVDANPKAPGIMASVAGILSEEGLVVRQALADDPEMVPSAKMTLVVEGQLSGKALERLNALNNVRAITILK